MFHVSGELQVEGDVTLLCSVNGVLSQPKLVILDNTVHIFLWWVSFILILHFTIKSRLLRIFCVLFLLSFRREVSRWMYLCLSSWLVLVAPAVAPMTGTIEKVFNASVVKTQFVHLLLCETTIMHPKSNY